MDSFAVSVSIGTKHATNKRYLGLYLGLYFAIFHVCMLLLGHATGSGLYQWIAPYASLLAALLLIFLGGKAIYGSYCDGPDKTPVNISHKLMLLVAFATSIDAIAAGFTLKLFDISVFAASSVIAIFVFLFSGLGALIGAKSGTYLADKAEILGGIVLMLIGFKIFLV